MSPTFNCPACGAPINLTGEYGEMVTCPYCRGAVPVPEIMRPARPPVTRIEVVEPIGAPTFENAPPAPQPGVQVSPEDARKWGRILVAFIIIVFVVPTCIGIAASIVGALAGIIVPFLALFFR